MYLQRKQNKTNKKLLLCPERIEQLFEGAEKYGMVEIVPEETAW